MPSYVLSHNYPQAYKAALSQKMKGASCFRKGQEYQAIQHFMEGMLQLVEGIPIFAIEEEILQDEEIPLTDALMSNIVAAMVKPRVKEPVTVRASANSRVVPATTHCMVMSTICAGGTVRHFYFAARS